jgi:tRNA-dihydrouridine synthase C
VQAVVVPKHQAGRVKQWLHYLRRVHPEAQQAYERLRTVGDASAFGAALALEVAQAVDLRR